MRMDSPDLAVIDKHRLAGLQDGVYSIAMTLLVLELKLPPLHEPMTDAALLSALLSLWPRLLTWLLSFWVLAVFWLGDVRALATFRALDRLLLRLSLMRLALVSLLPFSSALVGEYGDRTAGSSVYAGHLVLLGAVQVMRHVYARRHPALVTWPDTRSAADAGLQAWGMLACAAAAFGLAFVVPGYNMLALTPLLFLQLFRRLARPDPAHGG